MRLLLDTHIFLWVLADDRRLTPAARELIRSADSVAVSVVSAWEMAIKSSIGKLEAPSELEGVIRDSGLSPIPLDFIDVSELARLPLHHADPFDRMLVAQARARSLTLLTHDRQITLYDVPFVVV